jgi:dGTPase
MNIREKQEQSERELLSPYATLSAKTKGRKKQETECEIRTCFQRDRDRILHCKAFRRLKDKTQVFLAPKGDHYRTRLTHTLEVSQNARTIARALNLNELLAEAIALGHDLGHTPFGHAGERVLNEMNPMGFRHNEQSVRVVQYLEKNGRGLNLTWEVLDGMENHSMKSNPSTLEGKVVRLADKIAYINHDIDDAIRGKILTEEGLPAEYTKVLGHTVRERMNTMILDIVNHSENKDDILMSEEVYDAMFGLRKFMFQNVYQDRETKKEERKIRNIIEPLYEHYLAHMEELPVYNRERALYGGETKEQAVCDYIAGMTDHFAIETYKEIYIPKFWIAR